MKFNALFGLIFFIFIMTSTFSNFASYDEGIYFGIAKHFRTLGAEGFYEPIRPIGVPLVLLPFFSYEAARIGMLFLVGILLYWIYKLIPEKEVALWSIILLTTSPLFIKYSWHLMNDGIAYLFPIISLFYIKKKPLISGLLLGVGFLFKFPVILSILVIIFSLNKLKDSIPFFVGLGIGIAPQFISLTIFNSGGFFERLIQPFVLASGFMKTNVWIYGQSGLSKFFYWISYFATMIIAGFFIYLIWRVDELVRKKKYELPKISYSKSLFAIIVIYTLYFSFFVDRFDERYLLSVIPAASIIAAIALSKIKNIYWLPYVVLLLTIPVWFSTVPNDLDLNLSGDIFTNTGYTYLYEDGKIILAEGIFIVGDYIDYKLSNKDNYVLSLYEYRCNNDYCDRERTNAINWVIDNENITDCGFLHGHQIIVLGQKRISSQECANRINWDLSTPKNTSYFIYVSDKDEIYFDFNLFLENETNFMISRNRYWDTPENSECYDYEWGVYSCRKIYLYPEDYSSGSEFRKAIAASKAGTVVGVEIYQNRLDYVIKELSKNS